MGIRLPVPSGSDEVFEVLSSPGISLIMHAERRAA